MINNPDLCPLCSNSIIESVVCHLKDENGNLHFRQLLDSEGFNLTVGNYSVKIEGNKVQIFDLWKPFTLIFKSEINDWDDLKNFNTARKIFKVLENYTLIK